MINMHSRTGPVVTGNRITKAAQLLKPGREAPKSEKFEVFPWMTCLPTFLGTTTVGAPNGTAKRVTRPNQQDPAFYNNTSRRIIVDEMRIACANLVFDNPFSFHIVNANFALAANIRMPGYVYLDNWLPIGYLNNQTNRFTNYPAVNGAYTLPEPYFLPMKSPFRLRIRQSYQSDYDEDLSVWFAIYGIDSRGFPMHSVKRVEIPYRTTFNPPYYYDVLFDDDQNRLLRDCTITHVGFCFDDLPEALNPYRDTAQFPTSILSALELQFRPERGPLWMREDDWIPLWMLQDQPGDLSNPINDNDGNAEHDFSYIIHRFEAPVVLNYKDEIVVDLKVLNGLFRVTGFDDRNFFGENTPIWCAFYGRQEAR